MCHGLASPLLNPLRSLAVHQKGRLTGAAGREVESHCPIDCLVHNAGIQRPLFGAT